MPEAQTDRLAAAFKRLKVSAVKINEASDDLAKTAAEIDRALSQLNVGIVCWVTIEKQPADMDVRLGYAKHNRRWGLLIEQTDAAGAEIWHFNEAPRFLRLRSVSCIPGLVESMVAATDAASRRLQKANKDLSVWLEPLREEIADGQRRGGV